jgi:nucleoside phosphorylase
MSAYIAKPSGSGIATIGAQCNTGNAATCACLRADGTACTATILTGICYGTSTFTTTVQRMSVTLTCASSCTSLNAYLWPGEFLVSTGTSRYGGVQVETGAFATSYIPTVGTAVARLRDLLYTTLTQSIDAAGCFAATVRHGTVFNGINGWISTDQVGLYAQSATTLESVTSSGGAGITVPSLLSTTATARTYWNASVVGLESGGVSDTDVTGGTMSSDSIISFGDYLDGHVRGIRVNTNIGGCQ